LFQPGALPLDFAMKLIVTADDFGLSQEINRAVVRACRDGILTSCSLMVGENAFPEAVKLAKEAPGLGVGLHLTTVQGKPVLPPDVIPHLTSERGDFSPHAARAGWKYYFSPVARRELCLEIQAQFEKFAASGLPCSHVDGHLHHHIHPVILGEVLRQCKRFGIRAIRVPVDSWWMALELDRSNLIRNFVYFIIFSFLGTRMKARLRKEGIHFADRVYGNFLSGKMSKEYFLFVLRHLHQPVNEIYFHPAEYDEGRPLNSVERQLAAEREILCDPAVKKEIEQRGIELVHYGNLAG
jgi:hopanoid biosynthesis associated protein HpnK